MAKVDQLTAELAEARNAESAARDRRVALEEELVAVLGIGDNERQTIKTGVGLKLVVQTGYNYRLASDFDRSVVPHKETVKFELDKKAYESLEGDAKRLASQFITVTPKKPSVTVSLI